MRKLELRVPKVLYERLCKLAEREAEFETTVHAIAIRALNHYAWHRRRAGLKTIGI